MERIRKHKKRSKCVVANCPGANTDDIHLYKIPKYDEEAWCANLKVKPSDCHTRTRVCSRHFEDWWVGSSRCLKAGARPTLNLGHDEDDNELAPPILKGNALMRSCCILDCDATEPPSTLYRFPKDEELRKNWLQACVFKKEFAKKYFKLICSKHFEPSDFENKRLKADAVPKCDYTSYDSDENNILPTSIASEEDFMETGFIEADNARSNDEMFAENIDNEEKPFKNIGVQTMLDETRMCAFVTATQNLLAYNVNCCHCDATFSVTEWNSFLEHFESNHRKKPESFFESETTNKKKPKEVDANCKSKTNSLCAEVFMAKEDCCSDDDEFVFSFDDGNSFEAPEKVNTQNSSPMNEQDDTTDSDPLDEDGGTDDFDKILNDSQINRYKVYSKTKLNELSVTTTDAAVMCELIDLLASQPVMWFFQFYRTFEFIEAFKFILKKLNQKLQLPLKDKDLHWSIQKLGAWYQQICENEEAADKLSYPQREYFEKLSKFLPDKPNGISCVHCQRLMPDHLQYFVHKKLEHPEYITVNDVDETNSTFMGIAKDQVNNYLNARYPIRAKEWKVCQICNYNSKLRWKYYIHIKEHLNIRDFLCDICGADFRNVHRLEIHKRRHFDALKVVCKICNKVCNDNQLLSMHRKRYHRPIEGTIEEIEASLNTHVTRNKIYQYTTRLDANSQQKHYVCNICEKDYSYYLGIVKHFRTSHKNQCPPKVIKKRKSTVQTKVLKNAGEKKKKIVRLLKLVDKQST